MIWTHIAPPPLLLFMVGVCPPLPSWAMSPHSFLFVILVYSPVGNEPLARNYIWGYMGVVENKNRGGTQCNLGLWGSTQENRQLGDSTTTGSQPHLHQNGHPQQGKSPKWHCSPKHHSCQKHRGPNWNQWRST